MTIQVVENLLPEAPDTKVVLDVRSAMERPRDNAQDTSAYDDILREPIKENAALGEVLSAIVSDFAPSAERVVAVPAVEAAATPVVAEPVAPAASASVGQPVASIVPETAGETVVTVDAASVVCPDVSALRVGDVAALPVGVEGETVEQTPRETAVQTVVVAKKVEVEGDLPEAPSADALVAAGVVPQTVVPQTVDVAPVVTAEGVAPVEGVSEVTGASRSSAILLEVAAEVADAILVTPGLLNGQGEVRVQLKPDVLSGTEVRVVVTGRELGVEFAPVVYDTAVFIERNLSQLTQHLASRISVFNVNVSVRSNVKRAEMKV